MPRKKTSKRKSGGKGFRKRLTRKGIEEICSWVRQGNYQGTAAKLAGYSESAFYAWKKEAEDGKRPDGKPARKLVLELVEALEKALAEAESLHVQNILHAGTNPKHWQASAWWLERRDPKRWGRPSRVEVTGKDGGPIESKASGVLVVPAPMEPDEWEAASAKHREWLKDLEDAEDDGEG